MPKLIRTSYRVGTAWERGARAELAARGRMHIQRSNTPTPFNFYNADHDFDEKNDNVDKEPYLMGGGAPSCTDWGKLLTPIFEILYPP